MNIRLVEPSINYEKEYLDFYSDWTTSGEKIYPRVLRKRDPSNFEELVNSLLNAREGKNLPEGYVPESVYWLVDMNNHILGAVTIRHRLTEQMLNSEGHIGAGIRPSERRKGYAAEILALSLEKMREMGLDRALVTCNEDNIGSEKTIVKNGGIRDDDFVENHGNVVKRFWITL